MRSNYEIFSILIMFLSIAGIMFSSSFVFATPLPESEQGQQNDVTSEEDDDSGDGTSTAEQIEPEQGQEPIPEGQQSLDDSAGLYPESERRYECDPKVASCQPPPPDCEPDIMCCLPSPPPQPRPEKDKCEPIEEEDSSDSREGIRG